MNRWRPVITEAARPYLEIQQGRISDFRGVAWEKAYEQQLHDTYDAIAPYLPPRVYSILDIGAGMGGIDALLAHHSAAGRSTRVMLVDGIDDDPTVREHNKTYSSASAAREFLGANGVPYASSLLYKPGDAVEDDTLPKVDLVISVQAWCFHFEPGLYCKLAQSASKPGTRWILDVRNDNAAWAAYLFATPKLKPIDELPGFTEKYTRMVFEVEA